MDGSLQGTPCFFGLSGLAMFEGKLASQKVKALVLEFMTVKKIATSWSDWLSGSVSPG